MILKYQQVVNSRTFKKVPLVTSLTGKRRHARDKGKAVNTDCTHSMPDTVLLLSQRVNTWVLYLLNRDRGKEPKLLMVLYVQNLQVKLFEKQICHSDRIMIVDYEEQLGDKVCYAHQCHVHLASLWTSLAYQDVKIK